MYSKEISSFRFAGLSERKGPMSWPQHAIWSVVEWEGPNAHQRNTSKVWELPDSVTDDDVLTAMRLLLETHETLRTTFDAAGEWPTQIVHGNGAVRVHRYHTTVPNARACVEAAIADLSSIVFDLAADIPMAVGIVRGDDRPVVAIAVFSHVAVDGWSATVVDTMVRDLVRDGADALRAYAGQTEQPIERAEFEQSAAGRLLAARTTDFWLRAFREIPVVMFAGGPQAQARIERATMTSPAMAKALAQISTRDRVSTAAVLAGTTALVLSVAMDVSDVALRTIVSTRFSRASRYSVAALNLNGLFRVTPAPGPAGEYFAQAATAFLHAAKYSQCNPLELERELDTVIRDRGVAVKQYMFFNDMSHQGVLAPAPRGGDTAFEVAENPQPDKDSKFLVSVWRVVDAAELEVYVDRRFIAMGPVDILRAIEQIVLVAAEDPRLDAAGFAWSAVHGAASRS